MNTASSFERWKEAASEIDLLENRFQWKDDPKSDDYDYKKIQQRLMALRSLIEADDTEAIIRYLRSRLVRNIGGIGNHSLHTFMYTGTKTLIEEYISEVETALKQVLHDSSIEKSRKLAFFNETRHAFGRSALLLSGGGSMGLYHAGVLKALYQRDLLPRILSGASVGSILAAFVATRTDKEIEQLFLPNSVELSFFPPHKGSFMRKLRRLLSHGVLMDISVLLDCVRSNIGDFTFAEAYARTGRVLNIVVAPDSGSKDSPLLLNHLTSPDVLVWSASIASCAIPGVYLPVELMCKDCDGNVVPYFSEGVKWRDGSVVADLPMERLSELFNVNHFIVSQVNPHVLPFVFPTLHAEGSSLLYSMVSFLGGEIKAILLNLYNFTSQHIPLTKIIWDLLNQQYMGDITLFPQTKLIEFSLILTNPSEERLVQCMSDAEKYTFRHIALIENHCRIETVLDECVRQLRSAMILSRELSFNDRGGSPSALLTSRTRSWSIDQFAQMQRTVEASSNVIDMPMRVVSSRTESLPNVNAYIQKQEPGVDVAMDEMRPSVSVEDLSDSDVVPFL